MAEDKSKPQPTPDLDSLRREIDAVDEQIHALISARAGFAQQVAIAKGDDAKAIDFFRPEREAQVLRAVVERNAGPLTDEEMVRLFREIMSACLSQQEPLKIGYLGPEGTFTQTAVHKQFGHSVRALPLPTIDEVFHEVEATDRKLLFQGVLISASVLPGLRGCSQIEPVVPGSDSAKGVAGGLRDVARNEPLSKAGSPATAVRATACERWRDACGLHF